MPALDAATEQIAPAPDPGGDVLEADPEAGSPDQLHGELGHRHRPVERTTSAPIGAGHTAAMVTDCEARACSQSPATRPA